MAENKPNLLYIYADGLRYQSVGYNGDIKAKTPNIDMLAQCSVVMDNCVCNHPLACSYCASLFSGKYSTSTGMINEKLKINTAFTSFAEILSNEKYKTDFIGKWNLFSSKNKLVPKESRLGFNGFFASFAENKNSYYLNDEKIKFDGFSADIQTDLAVNQIKKHAEDKESFAIFLALSAPSAFKINKNINSKYSEIFEKSHFAIAENYDSINDYHADSCSKLSKKERKRLNEFKRAYYSALYCVDDNIGRLMQTLIENELDENTIIVFTSNYGEMFGSHGRKGNNIFYEEAVRVPFILRYGEKIASGKNEDCFGTVDIMPTLLGLMKIKDFCSEEGRDKSNLILNGVSNCGGQLLMGMGPSKKFGGSYEWRAFRTKQFTYAVYKADNEEMLFDNFNDPLQTVNLIYDKNYIEIGKRIKDEMYAEMARINDSFEKSSYYKNAIK